MAALLPLLSPADAAPPRLDLPGIPQHIVQRGNNRAFRFFCDDDRFGHPDRLSHHARVLEEDVHACALMTNHVHLLAAPHRHGAISTVMQDSARDYVRLVNAARQKTVTGSLTHSELRRSVAKAALRLRVCGATLSANGVVTLLERRAFERQAPEYRS